MKLSKILSVALLGAVAMTSTAMAGGTEAGTIITNTPSLSYSMSGTTKALEAPATSFVVDKKIDFELTRSESTEHKVVAGEKKTVEFQLTNLGNSAETFKLSKWYNEQNVQIISKKFYVDSNDDGILNENEKVDQDRVENLAANASKKIWMELDIDSNAVIGKRSDSGLLAQAVDNSFNPYVASATNTMNAEDIVFADGSVYTPIDVARDGKMSIWYGFTVIEDANNVQLNIKLTHDQVWSDPVNGTNNPKAIPGAVLRKIWTLTNSTQTIAKNVVFAISADSASEEVKLDLEGTQLANGPYESPQYANDIHYENMVYGKIEGDTVTYTIPEIKPNELRYIVFYTTIK